MVARKRKTVFERPRERVALVSGHRDETVEFMSHWKSLLDCVMPGYVKEGKQQLAIAIGCTGGQHRSVAIAEATGDYLRTRGYRVSVTHRDLPLAESVQNELAGETKVQA